MGKYSVPGYILQLKPKGTMVKCISGHYYVYEYSTVTGADGKRHTKMGKVIGAIKEGIGFVPNNARLFDEEISTLDFGEYAISMANSQKTLSLLMECFNRFDAVRIYIVSLVHFIHGFTYLKDIHKYYEMSVLSLKYPSLKMGYDALSSLYDSLGRRQGGVLRMEEKLVEGSSRQVAIDGHVIGCISTENDLAEKGYKFPKLGEPQINLLMAYDVNTGLPLFTRIYEGGSHDKVSVRDLLTLTELKDILFIVDRGFYSAENLRLFTENGNSYIIPLAKNLSTCKKAVSDMSLAQRFMYQKGRKGTVVEYKDESISGERVLVYRDLNEAAAEQANYLRHQALGDKSYTDEGFHESKDFMGVIVLQTSLAAKTAQEIYELYKKRWSLETFFNYFKNGAGYHTLYLNDYYKTQGLAFIMLTSALIHSEFEAAAACIKGKSVQDCILDAKMVKANLRKGKWIVCNCKKNRQELFAQLHTTMAVELASHT